jgi:hypothetical protein
MTDLGPPLAACEKFDAVTELLGGEVGERLVRGGGEPAHDDRRQARELARLICKSEAAVERVISLCEQQAADLLAPHVMTVMSLQIILRMHPDMTGVDQALATVLGSFDLDAERRRRTDWRERELSADRFSAEHHHANDSALPHPAREQMEK